MRRDSTLEFSREQDISANAGNSTVSTNVVDLGAITDHAEASLNHQLGINGKLFLNCVVDGAAFVAAVDGAVVTIALYADTDAVPTTGGDVIITRSFTANIATAQADGTKLFSIPIPVERIKRYLGVLYSVATQNLTAGAVSCWIGPKMTEE